MKQQHIPPYVHPDYPIPRPAYVLWNALEEIMYPFTPLKMYWIGGKSSMRLDRYVPAIVNYKPGIQHRLAIDFNGKSGKWIYGNRIRSHLCAQLGIEYMTIKRTATRAEMMTEIGAVLSQLRKDK